MQLIFNDKVDKEGFPLSENARNFVDDAAYHIEEGEDEQGNVYQLGKFVLGYEYHENEDGELCEDDGEISFMRRDKHTVEEVNEDSFFPRFYPTKVQTEEDRMEFNSAYEDYEEMSLYLNMLQEIPENTWAHQTLRILDGSCGGLKYSREEVERGLAYAKFILEKFDYFTEEN